MGKAGDAKIPGELLGDYQVSAELENSTCGQGALGSQEHWAFNVRLSHQGPDLYWLNGREAISGSISADGTSFGFDTRLKVQATPARQGRLGCVIWRSDLASGKFVGRGSDVSGFSGNIKFTYTPEGNSDCTPLIGVSDGFAGLPCEMSYSMRAVRGAPKP
jgi:hypothetical protein